MAYLQLRGIEKFFGEHRAIKGIDLTIQQGEFIVFVGPSGCGKSTLLRLIAGLENIDGGSLMLDGRDITDQPSSKRDLAMVFQSYALYPHMSVYENMSFALKLAKVDPAIVIDEKVQSAQRRILNLTHLLGAHAQGAVGRAAPARRHRPRHRACAQGVSVRRAAVQPRRGPARPDPGGDRQAAPRPGRHHHLRHARPGGGHDPGRPRGGAARRALSSR